MNVPRNHNNIWTACATARADRAAFSRSTVCVQILTLFAGCLLADSALGRALDLDRAVAFDITPQLLDSALIAFSTQAHIQLLIAPDLGSTTTVPAIKGKLSARVALNTLLRDTGLTYAALGKSISVTRDLIGVESSDGDQQPTQASGSSQKKSPSAQERGRDGAVNYRQQDMQEVIVTAQKRMERLQDVPVPVTAISAAALVENNQLGLREYYAKIPGLTISTDAFGGNNLFIRGIATDAGNPTVGVTIDDAPFISARDFASAPDLDPSDLASIEILRGPQGTLYGASSMGGLLKYVTADPSTDRLSGRVQIGANGVHDGSKLGYDLSGEVNIPIEDTLAIRASGFTREDPGYVDNILTGERDVNRTDVSGGHISALWRPSEMLSAKLSAIYQDTDGHGSPLVQVGPGFNDLQQSTIRGSGHFDTAYQAYSATVSAKLGGFDITSVTGFSQFAHNDVLDCTICYDTLPQDLFNVSGGLLADRMRAEKFSEELRVSMPIGTRLNWLLGGFYSNQHNQFRGQYLAADDNTGVVAGSIGAYDAPASLAEYSVFTNLTIRFTHRFDVQLGGRESHYRASYSEIDTGPLFGPADVITPKVVVNDNAFTYLFTPRFKLTDDLMVYARLASGYREGGPNPNCVINNVSCSVGPDKTSNFELGAKGEFFSHALSFDASLYYIDWKDIAVTVTGANQQFGYQANAGRAKSQGVELSVESRPVIGLTIAAWIALNDAELTEPLPSSSLAFGLTGDRLPYSSRVSGSVSVEQEFPLLRSFVGYVGGSANYLGDRLDAFTGTPQRVSYPSYTSVDLRAGVRQDDWTVNCFLRNVTDKRGVVIGNFSLPDAFQFIQPRTIGISLSRRF